MENRYVKWSTAILYIWLEYLLMNSGPKRFLKRGEVEEMLHKSNPLRDSDEVLKMAGDCSSCRTFKTTLKKGITMDCYGEEWWPPSQISYCRRQVLWYLANSVAIRLGEWPQNPSGSGYVDPLIRTGNVKMPCHDAEELAAEIDARLNMLPGIERKLLEVEVDQKKPLKEFSEYSITCLHFISGFKRKIATCSECGGFTVMQKEEKGWTQVCSKCHRSWGHLSFSLWKRQRKFRNGEYKTVTSK